MDELLTQFEEILAAACSRVGREYFQIPVADADAVYRERVYCYELYHQMRSGWGEFGFSLGGEVDKMGHPHFLGGPYANAKPDFLVHQPGNMGHNLACVEVKPLNRAIAGFIADLRKLTWFCQNAAYHRGIFLVYGTPGNAGAAGLRNDLLHTVQNAQNIDLGRIHVFFHPAELQPCERIDL